MSYLILMPFQTSIGSKNPIQTAHDETKTAHLTVHTFCTITGSMFFSRVQEDERRLREQLAERLAAEEQKSTTPA